MSKCGNCGKITRYDKIYKKCRSVLKYKFSKIYDRYLIETSYLTQITVYTATKQTTSTYCNYNSWELTAIYTGCPRRNGQNFGRVFLMLNYTDITQNTYIQSWTVTEIMAREKCGLLGCPRTVRRPWRHTHALRMPGNEKPLANIGMQWPWRDNAQLRPYKLLGNLRTNTTVVRVSL